MESVKRYLEEKLNIPKDWDKYDYKMQRFSFDDIEECLISFIDQKPINNRYLVDKSVDTIQQVKKELSLTDADIAEFFQYANAISYRNSARKEKLDHGIINMFLKCKEHFSLNCA